MPLTLRHDTFIPESAFVPDDDVSMECNCPDWIEGKPLLAAMDRERFFRDRPLSDSPFSRMKYCPWCGNGLAEVTRSRAR